MQSLPRLQDSQLTWGRRFEEKSCWKLLMEDYLQEFQNRLKFAKFSVNFIEALPLSVGGFDLVCYQNGKK